MSRSKRVPIPKKNGNEGCMTGPELKKIETEEILSAEQ